MAKEKPNEMPVLTGPEKAAVLFLHMPEQAASEVFKGLSRREMRALTAASKKVQTLSTAQVDSILADFLAEVNSSTASLRAASQTVLDLAVKALGTQTASEMIDGGTSSLNETLADMETRTIANLIKKEHPQTIALVLAHMPPNRAAEVLIQVPTQAQADVLKRLANFDPVSPEVIGLVEEALLNEVSMMGKGSSRKFGGVEMVADILNQVERSREEALLRQIEENDQPLAEEVRGLMFVFDDLMHLDARGIQTLLKEVERSTLVLALKAADEDLKQHILKNLSSRAVEMILEEMENRGPVRLSEVEKAQGEVVRVALALTSSGAISLQKGEEDALV